MNRLKFSLTVICVLLMNCIVRANTVSKEWFTTVAVVVDKTTYLKVGSSVDSYIKSIDVVNTKGKIERRGVLVIDKWEQPDSIRAVLKKMWKNNNLEGAVFVGDIPIPMIRDAHHLTTAFKMSPKKDWKESSVPSDRFYDCFSLEFNYLKQDKDVKLYHYYSLAPQSVQSVSCDIYSARIKAPKIEGKDKYTLISEYLNKVVAEKANKRQMSKVLYFAGHGYNSESMNARIDETAALYEQFPFLTKRRGADLDYIDYSFDKYIRYRLISTLADKNLDLAILHHHGAEDTQYFNGSPYASDAATWLEQAKNFFRSKIRNSKDTTAAKDYYIKNYDIPADWVEGVFNPKLVEQDSIYAASLDLGIADLKDYVSGSKIVLLDACFNGSFHLDDYIAAHHIFNPGGTIVVKANSVNTLQDTWTNELLGLLNCGVCAGNWTKGQMTLESHLIGDPTFSFKAESFASLNYDISKEKSNAKFWRSLLNNNLPDISCLAIKNLCHLNAITSAELVDIQKNSCSAIVRLEAFMRLKDRADEYLLEALKLALDDSYELTVRLGALTASKNGSSELIPYAVKMYFNPRTSARVDFQLKYLMDALDTQKLVEELKAYRENSKKEQVREFFIWPTEENYAKMIKNLERVDKTNAKEFAALRDKNTPVKEKNFTISGQRNACNNFVLEDLFFLLNDSTLADEQMRASIAEALGWYKYSCKKAQIIEQCKALVEKEKTQTVKNELIKTINRLK